MKFKILVLLLITISCSPLRQISKNGMSGLVFEFSDSSNRNLMLVFESDSIFSVKNVSYNSHNARYLNFDFRFSYERPTVGSIKVLGMINDDQYTFSNSYVRPYQPEQLAIGRDARSLVFPNLIGDTLWFSSDYKVLQIREFSFQLSK